MPDLVPTALLAWSLSWVTAAAQSSAAPSTTAATPEDRLLVCNKADHSLSIFDPRARREIATVPTGRAPHEVAASVDGKLAVVTDYGDQQPGQTLTVVDVAGATVLRTIALSYPAAAGAGQTSTKPFLRPHGVCFAGPDRVLVTSEMARQLLLVNVTTGAIERTWSTAQTTMHMVAVTADLRRASATSIREGSVVFFDLTGTAAAGSTPIECAAGSEGLAIDPVTGETWVGNRAANTVSIVDAKGKVSTTLTTGDFPFRLAFTPAGDRALVTCAEGGQLQVFDTKTHALVHDISVHGDRSEQSALPMGVTTDRAGARAYVTCGRGEFVAVIDLQQGEVVDRLPAKKGCDGIAWAALGSAARATPAVELKR